MKLYNLDRQHSAAFGGMPSDFDFCMIYDDDNKRIFSGTMRECREFMEKKNGEENQ